MAEKSEADQLNDEIKNLTATHKRLSDQFGSQQPGMSGQLKDMQQRIDLAKRKKLYLDALNSQPSPTTDPTNVGLTIDNRGGTNQRGQ